MTIGTTRNISDFLMNKHRNRLIRQSAHLDFNAFIV